MIGIFSPQFTELLVDKLHRSTIAAQVDDRPRPHYGEDIFVDDGPRTFADYVGQKQAIRQLRTSIGSAKTRRTRLAHTALVSGAAGLGKTSLARLIAAEMGVGIFEISGKISVDEIRPILTGMQDHDILFIDEAHLLMSAASSTESWLLSLMEGGILQTSMGREPMPNITVVAATTEFGKLKPAWQSRFMIRPVLVTYSNDEALEIARSHALREGFGTESLPMPEDKILSVVAQAANNSPRAMKPTLIALRDIYLADPELAGTFDVDTALQWVGLTRDGLDVMAMRYLLALIGLDGRGSETSIKGVLGEPGTLSGTEQLLQQRGYLRIEARGRQITELGTERAAQLAQEQGLL